MSPGTLTGTQPIYGQIGTDAAVATGETISLGGATVQKGPPASAAGHPLILGRAGGGLTIINTAEKSIRNVQIYTPAGTVRSMRSAGSGALIVAPSSGTYWARVGERLMRVAVVR